MEQNRVHSNEKYHDPCGCALDIDIYHAGLHAGFLYNGLNMACDVIQAVVGGGGYLDGLLHFLKSIIEQKLQNNPVAGLLIRFNNNTRKVLRIIRQNKGLSMINILGMALGLAASGIILSFVHQEYHFDSSLKGSDKIFRIIQKGGDRERVYLCPAG